MYKCSRWKTMSIGQQYALSLGMLICLYRSYDVHLHDH